MTKSYFTSDIDTTATRTLHTTSPPTGENPQRTSPERKPSPTRKNTCRAKKTTINTNNFTASRRPQTWSPASASPPQDCARICAYIDDTANPRSNSEIGLLVGVSTRTIERLRLNFELFDAPYPPRTAKVGRPTALNEGQQAWVLQFFTEKPYAHLADATAAVWERFDVNVSLKSVANILHKHRWSRTGQRGSNKRTLRAPDAARDDVPGSSTQRQNETSNVVSTPEGSQVQEETIDIVPQLEESPPPSPAPVLASPPSPVVLPEISLPAFFLQSDLETTRDGGRPVMPLLSVRQPCPTCGCSSREHQNV